MVVPATTPLFPVPVVPDPVTVPSTPVGRDVTPVPVVTPATPVVPVPVAVPVPVVPVVPVPVPVVPPVVDRLAEEHEVIADVLEQVDRALVGLVSAEPARAGAALEELSGTVDLLTDTLLSHLAYEERELLHPLATVGMG